MENLSFEKLPEAVSHLTHEIGELKRLLLEKDSQPTNSKKDLLTVQEAGDFLSLSVATIYSKVSRGELPVMKQGKRLYFSRAELLEFLKAGRRKTNAEIEAEATSYLKTNKKLLPRGCFEKNTTCYYRPE